jgi:DNA repair protein RecO (recombination protein O)
MTMIKTKGIVIKEQAYKEQDKILTIFTEDEGKVQCIARGVRRPKSGLLASTQVFAYSEFVYYPGKSFGNINQAHLIESFYPLRDDLNKMALAAYLLDLMNNGFDFHQKNPQILKLLLYILFYIAEKKAKSDQVLVGGFQLKLISVLGYQPNLNQCVLCESKDNLSYFSIDEYGLLCKLCYTSIGYTYKINMTMIGILRDFLSQSIMELKNKNYPKDDILKLNDILDHYIGHCIGKTSKAYHFYKSMLVNDI